MPSNLGPPERSLEPSPRLLATPKGGGRVATVKGGDPIVRPKCKEMPRPGPFQVPLPAKLTKPAEPLSKPKERTGRNERREKKVKRKEKKVKEKLVFVEEGEEETEVEDLDDVTDARYGPGGKRRHPDDDKDDEDWGSRWKNPRGGESHSVRGMGYAVH